MPSETYKTMMRKVKRMADRSEELKALSHGEKKVGKIVLRFINDIEKARLESENGPEFVLAVDQEAVMLESKLKAIDSEVRAEVLWNGEEEGKDWKELRVEGVMIRWSYRYRLENKDAPEEDCVRIEDLWLEGLD